MARDLQSLEMAIGQFQSDLDGEAAKVFDKIDGVRVKAGDVFKRTHATIDSKAKTVDNVDKIITGLDRVNASPTSGDSSKSSTSSSGNGAAQPDTVTVETHDVGTLHAAIGQSAEKKT